MTDEIHKAFFVSLKQGGRNEMPSFHYVNFAGSLLHLMNCYSICRWTLPTRSPQIWHTVITCPIFLCCIMSSTAHRNTAHKAETKVPGEFSLPKIVSVSSFQARICETHCCPFGPVAQTKQVHYCLLALAFHLWSCRACRGALSSTWLQGFARVRLESRKTYTTNARKRKYAKHFQWNSAHWRSFREYIHH